MAHVLVLDPRHRRLPGTGFRRCPAPLLVELLARNEEMIVQLNLERQSVTGTIGFLTSMIAQHEEAAALLRAQLETGERRSS